MKILYTDIDYVLSLASEISTKQTKWGQVSRFNLKAVKIYNQILKETGAIPVISSDWKHNYTLQQLREIFIEFAGIEVAPIDITPTLWGIEFKSFKQLEECRAKEILMHVEQNNPKAWIAIDDLDLSPWISKENFVYLPRMNEGIKQSSKKEECIRKLNYKNKL